MKATSYCWERQNTYPISSKGVRCTRHTHTPYLKRTHSVEPDLFLLICNCSNNHSRASACREGRYIAKTASPRWIRWEKIVNYRTVMYREDSTGRVLLLEVYKSCFGKVLWSNWRATRWRSPPQHYGVWGTVQVTVSYGRHEGIAARGCVSDTHRWQDVANALNSLQSVCNCSDGRGKSEASLYLLANRLLNRNPYQDAIARMVPPAATWTFDTPIVRGFKVYFVNSDLSRVCNSLKEKNFPCVLWFVFMSAASLAFRYFISFHANA